MTTSNESVFDPASLYERMGDDPELLSHISGLFTSGYPGHIQNIKKSLAAKSPKELYAAIHSLKGEILIFGHQPSIQIAEKMEEMGRAGSTEGADPLLVQLEASLEAVFTFIKSLPANGKGE